MDNRKTLLGRLVVGDVFHAEGPSGASLICLTVSVTDTAIRARRVTTQEYFEFDRQTGVEKSAEQTVLSRINSVAPLPGSVLNVILGIDRKYRLLQHDEQAKLTRAEIDALVYAGGHYAATPL